AEAELRQQQQSEREERELSAALLRVSEAMISSLDTPVILERLCHLTTELIGCDTSATLMLFDEENVYRAVASYGFSPEEREVLSLLTVPASSMTPLVA